MPQHGVRRIRFLQVGDLYIEPLVTVVVAAAVLSEPLRPLMLLGGAAILSGVPLVNARRRA